MQRREIRYQAAVIQEHHVLLLRVHDRETDALYWLFPGGGREAGESAEECVRRELREETGLDVGVLGLLFTMPDIPNGMYDQLATYHCEVVGGIASPGIEPEVDSAEYTTIREFAWFDLRAPDRWGAEITHDPITFPLLKRLRTALTYV